MVVFRPAERRRSRESVASRLRLAMVLLGLCLFSMMIAQFWVLKVAITTLESESRESWFANRTKSLPHFAQGRVFAQIQREIRAISNSQSAKPISFLFNTTRWRVPAESRCDAIFGNGYSEKVLQCPLLRCHQNPVSHATFCAVQVLQLNPTKISVSKGNESIEDVIGRDESAEYPVYEFGALSTSQTCDIGEINGDRFPHHLALMMGSLTFKENSTQASCHEGVTLFVTRYEYANLYHTMSDWYNTFQVWAIATGLSRDVQIIFMDGHSKGSLDSPWETLFGKSPTFVSSISARSCFRQAILVPPGYTSALSVDMMNIADTCSPSPLVQNFAEWFVSRFGLGHVRPSTKSPKILIVLRHDYLAHPRVQGRPASRKIENEQELLDHTTAAFPHATIEAPDFENITFEEQIRAVRNATVVIGVHGAALSHILFAIPGSTSLVELMPPEYSARFHFLMFAKYVGARYERVQIGSEKPGGFHHVPVQDVIETLRLVLSR